MGIVGMGGMLESQAGVEAMLESASRINGAECCRRCGSRV